MKRLLAALTALILLSCSRESVIDYYLDRLDYFELLGGAVTTDEATDEVPVHVVAEQPVAVPDALSKVNEMQRAASAEGLRQTPTTGGCAQ